MTVNLDFKQSERYNEAVSPIPGTTLVVEQMGYRSWMCCFRHDETGKPVWGVFGIRTSSERVARQKCRELFDTYFTVNESEEAAD